MAEFGRFSSHMGYLLHRTDLKLIARIADALSELGVTPARASALVYIALHEGCDQMALGRALGINRGSTVKAIDELVRIGAVERRPGRDRRSNALHLTPSGAALRERVEEITETADAANFRVLSPEEQTSLRAMLKKLHDYKPERDRDQEPTPARPKAIGPT